MFVMSIIVVCSKNCNKFVLLIVKLQYSGCTDDLQDSTWSKCCANDYQSIKIADFVIFQFFHSCLRILAYGIRESPSARKQVDIPYNVPGIYVCPASVRRGKYFTDTLLVNGFPFTMNHTELSCEFQSTVVWAHHFCGDVYFHCFQGVFGCSGTISLAVSIFVSMLIISDAEPRGKFFRKYLISVQVRMLIVSRTKNKSPFISHQYYQIYGLICIHRLFNSIVDYCTLTRFHSNGI